MQNGMSALPPEGGHVRCKEGRPLSANSGHCAAGRFQNKTVRNAGAQRTRCDIAFAETTGRCAASAIAMPRPLAKQP